MRHGTLRAALIAGGLLMTACAGGEDMGEAQASDMDVAAGDELTCYIARGTFEETQDRPSPLRSTSFSYEGGEGLLCYGAPSAREREVMGALVPWGQPWRIGANEATTIQLTAPARLGDVELDAGTYSLYAIPGEGEWEIMINSSAERWGIPINDEVRASEIGSFMVTPEATDSMIETLQYSWEPMAEGTMGNLVLEWENTKVSLHVHPGG